MDDSQMAKIAIIDKAADVVSGLRSAAIGGIMGLVAQEVLQSEVALLEIVLQQHLLWFAFLTVCLHMVHITLANRIRKIIINAISGMDDDGGEESNYEEKSDDSPKDDEEGRT